MPATNWWVHVVGGGTKYVVDHYYLPQDGTTFPGNSVGYAYIELAEALLGSLVNPNADWHLHRIGKSGSVTRTYEINHDPTNPGSKHCPGQVPGYPSLQALADGFHLSALHNENSCTPT